jgi:hypothetical protein
MRTRRWLPLLLICLLALVLANAAMGKPLTLHPRWTLVTTQDEVQADGHYVFSQPLLGATHGTLLDERTNRAVTVTPPEGCTTDQRLSGPWIVARFCGQYRGLRLYDIQHGTWTPLIAYPAKPEGASASFEAAGAHWIKYSVIPCITGEKCDPVTEWQNIQTGQVVMSPWWRRGATAIPDPAAPRLKRTLCKPLRVPATPNADGEKPYEVGDITFFGRFAIAAYPRYNYIERCGSKLFRRITPTMRVVGSGSVVVSDTRGVFLPSLVPFKLAMPHRGAAVYAATDRMMFALDGIRVWSAPLPHYHAHHR